MNRLVALASWVATVVVLVGAAAAFAVSWLMAPPPSDPAGVAEAVLRAAESTADPAAAREAMLAALPADGSIVLANLPESALPGNDRLTVIHGTDWHSVDLNALAKKRSLGAAVGRDGTWVAVSVPPLPSRPFPAALAAALVTVLTGGIAVVTALLLVTRRRSMVDDRPTPAQPAAPDPELARLLGQRERLVRGVAELVGALPAEFEWRAARVLESADVQRVLPDGHVFDPTVHHAVGTEPTPDSARADTVARTLQAGWVDRGRVLVPARVVVFVAAVRPGVPP
jgi:hypothetical protein